MSSISSVETITPRTVSPSANGSTQESAWSQSEAGDSQAGKRWKGKERQTEHEYTGSGSDDDLRVGDITAYPPTNDSEIETRRVEENLRRWEVAERQRRKLARESALNTQGSPSLIGDVSRRFSHLWPEKKRSRHTPNTSLGTHVALQSQENLHGAPLDDIDASPTPSPLYTPTSSPRPSSDAPLPDDPFANPPDESLSPFADSHRQKTSMKDPSRNRQPMINTTRIPPTPKPLGLPPPRTPPPPSDLPPHPISPPTPAHSDNPHEDVKPTRWWHDWLCGCNEGPDRGGDYQAGRTNPYE